MSHARLETTLDTGVMIECQRGKEISTFIHLAMAATYDNMCCLNECLRVILKNKKMFLRILMKFCRYLKMCCHNFKVLSNTDFGTESLQPGPSCSKLTTSLVNVLLKFQTLILRNTPLFFC